MPMYRPIRGTVFLYISKTIHGSLLSENACLSQGKHALSAHLQIVRTQILQCSAQTHCCTEYSWITYSDSLWADSNSISFYCIFKTTLAKHNWDSIGFKSDISTPIQGSSLVIVLFPAPIFCPTQFAPRLVAHTRCPAMFCNHYH